MGIDPSQVREVRDRERLRAEAERRARDGVQPTPDLEPFEALLSHTAWEPFEKAIQARIQQAEKDLNDLKHNLAAVDLFKPDEIWKHKLLAVDQAAALAALKWVLQTAKEKVEGSEQGLDSLTLA